MFVIVLIAAFVFGHVPHWDGEYGAASPAFMVDAGLGEGGEGSHHSGAPDQQKTGSHFCPITWCSPSFLGAVPDVRLGAPLSRTFAFPFDPREMHSLSLTRDPPVPRFFS